MKGPNRQSKQQPPPPRTLLGQLIRRSKRTVEENCAAFEKTARLNGENATLSPRQMCRWMSGEVSMARPVMQRVAELHWGHEFEALVGPPIEEPDVSPALVRDYQRALGVTVIGTGMPGEALDLDVDGPTVEAAPVAVRPLHTDGTAMQLVITPGTALVVVPADHPVLLALVAEA
jgi:hypothetical protein